MIDTLHKIFQNAELAIIGSIGALIALRNHPEVKGRAQVALFIVTGGVIAYFSAGLVGEFFGIAAKHTGAVGFFIGIFGASLIDAIGRAIKTADLWGFVKSKWGGK